MSSFLASQSLQQQNTNQPIITYSNCPVCNSSHIQYAFLAKDHTVTKEDFAIWHCNNCTARFTQNIPDAASIGKYYQSNAYVSHSDTQEGLINKLYHVIRNYTLKQKRKLIQSVTKLSTGNLLDVGAGTGAFAATMQAAGWKVNGLEPDETARANAFQKYSLTFLPPDKLYELPSQHFDVITMWHVLEHVHHLHDYFQTYGRILQAKGKLIIAVPNYTSYDAEVYKNYWAAYDVPRHLYHFSPNSMQHLAQLHGFAVKQIQPMWFDSFYVAMLSEQCKTGTNNLLAAIWNGLISNIIALKSRNRCSSIVYVLEKIN